MFYENKDGLTVGTVACGASNKPASTEICDINQTVNILPTLSDKHNHIFSKNMSIQVTTL